MTVEGDRMELVPLLEAHRRHLWGLGYRLTGSASDADDLVQDTFERALTRPPPDLQRELRPWLTKVALNLGRDILRRRKRRAYIGPWLPSPVDTEEALADGTALDGDKVGRYDLLESVTMGFLVALEVLSPKQRAVLLLRDVFDYSGQETADALEIGLSDVKVTLHRARRKLASYDASRIRPSPSLSQRSQESLSRLLLALGGQDYAAVLDLVAHEAQVFTDGGGEFISARRVIRGRSAAARFLIGLARKRPPAAAEPVHLNGTPALLLSYLPAGARDAPRATIQVELAPSGGIRSLYTITASAKLRRLSSLP